MIANGNANSSFNLPRKRRIRIHFDFVNIRKLSSCFIHKLLQFFSRYFSISAHFVGNGGPAFIQVPDRSAPMMRIAGVQPICYNPVWKHNNSVGPISTR